jgi:hypothetical protein
VIHSKVGTTYLDRVNALVDNMHKLINEKLELSLDKAGEDLIKLFEEAKNKDGTYKHPKHYDIKMAAHAFSEILLKQLEEEKGETLNSRDKNIFKHKMFRAYMHIAKAIDKAIDNKSILNDEAVKSFNSAISYAVNHGRAMPMVQSVNSGKKTEGLNSNHIFVLERILEEAITPDIEPEELEVYRKEVKSLLIRGINPNASKELRAKLEAAFKNDLEIKELITASELAHARAEKSIKKHITKAIQDIRKGNTIDDNELQNKTGFNRKGLENKNKELGLYWYQTIYNLLEGVFTSFTLKDKKLVEQAVSTAVKELDFMSQRAAEKLDKRNKLINDMLKDILKETKENLIKQLVENKPKDGFLSDDVIIEICTSAAKVTADNLINKLNQNGKGLSEEQEKLFRENLEKVYKSLGASIHNDLKYNIPSNPSKDPSNPSKEKMVEQAFNLSGLEAALIKTQQGKSVSRYGFHHDSLLKDIISEAVDSSKKSFVKKVEESKGMPSKEPKR